MKLKWTARNADDRSAVVGEKAKRPALDMFTGLLLVYEINFVVVFCFSFIVLFNAMYPVLLLRNFIVSHIQLLISCVQ